jgi:mannosyltransferase OCH1-like enzyme
LWTDRDIDAFVESRFPDRLEFFRALPLDVHRWDLFRYMLLHEHGGLYVDMDIEPTRSFMELFDNGAELTLFREHPDDAQRMRRSCILANAVICCAPGHAMMAALIETICSLRTISPTRPGVCQQTGPLMLTTVHERCGTPGLVHDHRSFFPNPVPLDGTPGNEIGYFGTHRFASTWWKQVKAARDLRDQVHT